MKQKLAAGEAVIGTAIGIPDPFVAELMGDIGFDFLIIDTEHAPLSDGEVQNLLIALRPTESTLILRVQWNDPVRVKRLLDIGAEGIIFPWINSAAECRQAVAATKYPPEGIRGYGPRRAARIYPEAGDYADKANDNILVLGQIERIEAVERLDEILPTPGFDGVMIGPADLGISMGHLNDLAHPDIDAAIERVLAKCKQHGVPFGMFTGTLEKARQWTSRGGQIATVGGDAGFLEAAARQAKADIEALKASLG